MGGLATYGHVLYSNTSYVAAYGMCMHKGGICQQTFNYSSLALA